MEELRISRYRIRTAEQYAPAGRVVGSSGRTNADPAVERAQGPYETSYDVAHGYCSERLIVQP